MSTDGGIGRRGRRWTLGRLGGLRGKPSGLPSVARGPVAERGGPGRARSGRFTLPSLAPGGLSARLLLLTAAFVLAAQILIFIPSLAAYEEGWLADRVRLAEVASLAVEAAPARVIGEKTTGELLAGAGVVSVAVQSDGVLRLLLAAPRTARAPELVDLRRRDPVAWLAAPFRTLGPGSAALLRVVARPQFRSGDFVVIVVPSAPLRKDVRAYGLRLLAASVMTSAVAGLIVYAALAALLVAPIRRITLAMERFRARPDDPAARLAPSGRRDEIGRAESELTRMQEDLLTALKSRARLAALGEAVAKINHDLRNMLTSAQLASERLAASGDPRVAQALPRLERALDRAVRLAQDVLDYGRSEEPAPVRTLVPLAPAVEAAGEDAGLGPEGVALQLDVPPGLELSADSDQLHRVLVNLFRNARQAIEGAPGPQDAPPWVRLEARMRPGPPLDHVRLRVIDNGPGVPERVRERLFQPFGGSAQPGGTGLGLAIARDLARAHGGDLTLFATGPQGTTFELTWPEG